MKRYSEKDRDFLDIDNGFIRFVIDNFLFRGLQIGFVNETKKQSEYRKMKRWLQRVYGEEWRSVWKVVRDDMKKILRPYKKLKKFIKSHPDSEIDINKIFRPRQGGRPAHDEIFITILILRRYFIWKTGRPQWNRIVEIINYPESKYGIILFRAIGNI